MKKPVKFIVEVHDDIPAMDAFYYCMKVAQSGRESNNGKQHCYVTTFMNGVKVEVFLNRGGSERFRVSKPCA